MAAHAAGRSYDARKQRELRHMRTLATLLLALVGMLFLLALRLEHTWPVMAYVRAFAEAAMVGACADWFAVVALFRRPFGLPIPHTGIIPRNRERLGEALGRFISNNFLTPSVLARRLGRIEVAQQLATWFGERRNAQLAARLVTRVLLQILRAQPRERFTQGLTAAAIRGIRALPAAPLASRILSIVWAQPETRDLIDRSIALAEASLARNKEFIRHKVAQNSSPLVPRWVDGMLSERISKGLHGAMEEIRAPDHPLRVELQQALDALIFDLANNPSMQARGEQIKTRLLDNPKFLLQLEHLSHEIVVQLEASVSDPESPMAAAVESALHSLGQLLQQDPNLRALLNRWVRRAVLRGLAPRRAIIGDYIAAVVANWHSSTLTQKLELQIGADLQYIRINGTLVGGMVGLSLFIASKWLTS